jgi:hypothetical protein
MVQNMYFIGTLPNSATHPRALLLATLMAIKVIAVIVDRYKMEYLQIFIQVVFYAVA